MGTGSAPDQWLRAPSGESGGAGEPGPSGCVAARVGARGVRRPPVVPPAGVSAGAGAPRCLACHRTSSGHGSDTARVVGEAIGDPAGVAASGVGAAATAGDTAVRGWPLSVDLRSAR